MSEDALDRRAQLRDDRVQAALPGLPLGGCRRRLRPHRLGFLLQSQVVVDRDGPAQLARRLHAALRLLDGVPRLVRQMALLSRRDVDVGALRERVRVDI